MDAVFEHADDQYRIGFFGRRGVRSGDDFQECRLPGSVFAHEAMHLAGCDVQIDIR